MIESTMLMISDAPALIGSVGRSVEHFGLATLPGIDSALAYEAWDEVALILVHRRRRDPAPEVGRLLRWIASRRPIPTLVLGEPYDAEQAAELFRLGVTDYIGCPTEPAELAHLVGLMTARSRRDGAARPSAAPAPAPVSPGTASELFLDDSPEGARLMAEVRRVAPLDATILIGGETGTGKTRLARLIHDLSDRRAEPFLVVHCGALPPGLVEGEIFGHVRGAFTNANRDHPGQLAQAGRGTLFLDGIDSLSPEDQSKLLRAVEDRVFEPVGSNQPRPVRTRLIAASNRMLEQEVAAQRFRSDLYYRLNVVGFDLLPLRERRGSIPALTGRFLGECAARSGRGVASISGDALRALEGHDWPGNLRELRNVVERAVAIAEGREIGRSDLPHSIMPVASWSRTLAVPGIATSIAANPNRSTLDQIKRDAERSRIAEALEKHGNNRLRTAGELGISRMTLYKKLYKYGLMNHDRERRDGVA